MQFVFFFFPGLYLRQTNQRLSHFRVFDRCILPWPDPRATYAKRRIDDLTGPPCKNIRTYFEDAASLLEHQTTAEVTLV
jgi:hypothetical protein